MQYKIYRNNGNGKVYPFLLDVQSDIIGELSTRLVIPLLPREKMKSSPVERLTPLLSVDGKEYLLMIHEMASVRLAQLGPEVMDVHNQRHIIKNALDFLLDGF